MNKKQICMMCDGRKECKDENKYKKSYCNNYALMFKDIAHYGELDKTKKLSEK